MTTPEDKLSTLEIPPVWGALFGIAGTIMLLIHGDLGGVATGALVQQFADEATALAVGATNILLSISGASAFWLVAAKKRAVKAIGITAGLALSWLPVATFFQALYYVGSAWFGVQ